MSQVNVAVVQMRSRLYDVESNVATMVQAIGEVAGSQPAQLIVFPELAPTGYECGVRFLELADELAGYVTASLAEPAQTFGAYVAFGLALRHKVGQVLYNAAVLLQPDGEPAGFYAKVHLRGEERLVFREGFRYPLFETEIGQIGLMIGWDLAFPEVARIYALQGAEILCLPASWEEQELAAWRTLLPARALENGLYIAAANRVGEETSYRFGGHSAIVGPDGRYRALIEEDTAGQPAEGYAVARLNLETVHHTRDERGLLQYRQPSSYRRISKRY